ncbi:hypothetical protein [Methylobacterium goesingense]|uniref:Uncharacterized protein n=1 Tax=Methylobacterium goesingense TaxID=243690 RepID=A0ABV2L3G5_9HYPH|nr:hypothetical protein [Methylobacterium goesingense]GJD73123.1 hypothetical protein CFIICLFH_1348 [Methylobacterium goesingense]
MEQGNCLDSTRMSAVHEVDTRTDGEPALDAAITNLLQAPTRATASEPMSAARSQDDVPDLADACIEQVARLNHWDANTGSLTEEQGIAEMARWNGVFRRAIETPSAGLRDLAGKAYLMLADLDRFHPVEKDSSDDFQLMRVILGEVLTLGGLADHVGVTKGDPILTVIKEGRRLLRAYLDAHHIYEQDPNTVEPRPEWGEAGRALWAYVDATILQTVPLTAVGCRELTRFAVDYADALECSICDDDEQAISRLIAQSPLLCDGTENAKADSVFALAKAEAEALGVSGMGISELGALYDKLRAARELWGAAMCEPVAVASHSTQGFVVRSHYGSRAEFEDVRAGFLMDRIATEIANRPAINDWERDNQLVLRIQQEIACEGRIQDPALLAEIARTWG